MSADPNAYIAEIPCPKCGSKRATATPDAKDEFECRDCGTGFDAVRVG